MTKENLTSINVIIDRSGSMSGLASDTIGGFNGFVAEQKLIPGEVLFTLCTFSSNYTLVHDSVPLASVPDLDATTYSPSGGTALLDAMGETMDKVGAKLAAMPESDRPAKVLFLIITDGQENSSCKYSASQIKNMVEHQKSKYNWEFVFMGANIDAITEGEALGISTQNTLNYDATSVGTKNLYRSISESTTSYRGAPTAAGGFDFFGTNNTPNNKK